MKLSVKGWDEVSADPKYVSKPPTKAYRSNADE